MKNPSIPRAKWGQRDPVNECTLRKTRASQVTPAEKIGNPPFVSDTARRINVMEGLLAGLCRLLREGLVQASMLLALGKVRNSAPYLGAVVRCFADPAPKKGRPGRDGPLSGT